MAAKEEQPLEESFSTPRVSGTEPWARDEVLRWTAEVLGGRFVGLWEITERGAVRPVATAGNSTHIPAQRRRIARALRRWGAMRMPGSLWLGCPSVRGSVCVAPVRIVMPSPPPTGIERRGPDRVALELAALCVGLVGTSARYANASILSPPPAEALLDQLPAMVWTTNRDLQITSVCGRLASSLRPTRDQLPNIASDSESGSDRDSAAAADVHRQALGGVSVSHLFHHGECWFEARVEPLHDADGAPVGTVGVALDVTARERSLRELRSNHHDLEEFVEHASVGIQWFDPGGTILRANAAQVAFLGYEREEYEGRSLVDVFADADLGRDLIRRVFDGETLRSLEAVLKHRDGSERHVLINAGLRPNGGTTPAGFAIVRDITDRKRAEADLLRETAHDALTGLPNRVYMLERIDHVLQRARRSGAYEFAVLFVDVDRFKVVNDSLGHVAGDQLLSAIARRLDTVTRPGDLVARLGGDEFAILVAEVSDAEDVTPVARRVLQEFVRPFTCGRHRVAITASVGIARGAPGHVRPEDVLRDADLAMYKAKAGGRDRYAVFDVSMRDAAQTRMRLDTDLRQAVRAGEFELHYQPIVDLATGSLDGFEALARWRHPARGLLLPGEFIAHAEETGLIVAIGRWALREACDQLRTWHRAHPASSSLRMSVNVSAKQLADSDFVGYVSATLRAYGVDPRALCLEITEHTLMVDAEHTAEILGQLRDLGVRLYVDDFGTGYSSLSYLARLPIHGVKIDRMFVRRMGMRKTDHEVVRAITVLAENLRLTTIAEGVETAEQRARLLRLGCTKGQGVYFGEPLEAARAQRLLTPRG